MTKSEIDKKLSLYGECFNLRFYTSEKKYYLSSPRYRPMLLGVYSEEDRDVAVHMWGILEGLFDKSEQTAEQLNYIQNSISNAIKHQKSKIGEEALREVIEDYNEWMLGHKEGSDNE